LYYYTIPFLQVFQETMVVVAIIYAILITKSKEKFAIPCHFPESCQVVNYLHEQIARDWSSSPFL